MYSGEWFAACTYPRHEKKARTYLDMRGIETFLPVYRERHLWKNGVRSMVELPLFPGYIFVHISSSDRKKVLETPSIASLVGAGGNPTPLDVEEVERLRSDAIQRNARPHPYLTTGDRVRIKSGPLVNMEGILVSFKNQWRVVLSIELLRQSVSVEIDLSEAERIPYSSFKAQKLA